MYICSLYYLGNYNYIQSVLQFVLCKISVSRFNDCRFIAVMKSTVNSPEMFFIKTKT